MTSLGRRITFVAISWMLALWLAALQAFAQAGANGSAPASEEIFRPGGDVIAPRVIHETKPQYTPDAMRHNVRGDVVVECIVTREGVTTGCTALTALGYGLDDSALAAARLWQFTPGTLKGRPVNVRITITSTFTIAGGSLPQTLRPSGAPIDATARCTDGTFSWATPQSMACLAHAGVAAWWDAAPPRKQ